MPVVSSALKCMVSARYFLGGNNVVYVCNPLDKT
jgi:hypothetical protein